MTDEIVKYIKNGAIATITMNRPNRANTILPETMYGINDSLRKANMDDEIKAIILEGAGDNFCGGFDFSNGLEHTPMVKEENYDPGRDVQVVTDPYHDYMPTFMGLHRGGKPTIAKVHGYCVGGGSELALCADLVIASDDARFGTPYARVWGCHLSGMWIYRLGLAKAKYYALTGDWLSGEEAAKIELINFSYPLEDLDNEVQKLAEKLTNILSSQLMCMKLIVNQAYENMGLQSTQTLGPVLDGIMRNMPESRGFLSMMPVILALKRSSQSAMLRLAITVRAQRLSNQGREASCKMREGIPSLI